MRKMVAVYGMVGLAVSGQMLAAQSWCAVTTAKPYSGLMPGITSVAIGSMHRTSASVESPANSYVLTGDSLTLTAGQWYTLKISHTRDSVNFPRAGNSIRVWIDYDKDGSFSGAKELAVTGDALAPGESIFSFTVPRNTAAVTATRMRITAKMAAHTGHSEPTPCDDPKDPIGYHGEIEDYVVNVLPAPPRPSKDGAQPPKR
jgi:hypothetical protein